MKPLRCLIACEFSGRVRDAFARRGWDSWSCDLLSSEASATRAADRSRTYLGIAEAMADQWGRHIRKTL